MPDRSKVNQLPPATDRPVDPRIFTLMQGGATLGDAIRIALGGSIPKWLEQREREGYPPIHRTVAANTIYSHRRASDDVIAALVHTLGGTRHEWLTLLWQAMRPVPAPGGSMA